MNPFENLTPPNLDSICNTTSTQQTVLGIITTAQTQTCSQPILYYLGYGTDITVIFLTALLIKKILC